MRWETGCAWGAGRRAPASPTAAAALSVQEKSYSRDVFAFLMLGLLAAVRPARGGAAWCRADWARRRRGR